MMFAFFVYARKGKAGASTNCVGWKKIDVYITTATIDVIYCFRSHLYINSFESDVKNGYRSRNVVCEIPTISFQSFVCCKYLQILVIWDLEPAFFM